MADGWNPGPKYQMYLDRIQGLLSDEKRTVRDVYYALEARGFEHDLAAHGHDFEYRYVKRAVKKGRRHGYLDPALIIDESRRAETTVEAGHDGAESFVDAHVRGVWNAYRENIWTDQDAYVEVWLEKQSLASIFRPICENLNVRLEATRGDWSDSKVYEATQRLRERLLAGDDVVVLYWGDFNPSGFHAPVSVQETMQYYGIDLSFRHDDAPDRYYFNAWPPGEPVEFDGCDGTLFFDRQGINLDHIKRFDLPENPNPSSTDKDRKLRERFQRHVSDSRDVNVELNALKEYERDYLEDRIRESIEAYLDDDVLAETEARIEREQDRIERAVAIDDDVLDAEGDADA